MKNLFNLLKKLTLGWLLLTVIGYILFPVIAVIMTFGANFYNLIYRQDGTIRVYFSLHPGTPLFNNPVKGNTPAWITTGELIGEQTRYIAPGDAYSNPDMYWRDQDSYHRVCLRIGTSPADIVAFAANRGCYWLRNRNGEQYPQIMTVPALRLEWQRIEEINKNQPKMEFVYPALLPTLVTISPYSALAIMFWVIIRASKTRAQTRIMD